MDTHSEIAQQFVLPERQSKIKSLLGAEADSSQRRGAPPPHNGEQLYCYCQRPDSVGFMIACDRCENWFHGECVKISKKEADNIDQFYCKECRIKNPRLEIRYKRAEESSSDSSGSSRRRKETSSKQTGRRRHKFLSSGSSSRSSSSGSESGDSRSVSSSPESPPQKRRVAASSRSDSDSDSSPESARPIRKYQKSRPLKQDERKRGRSRVRSPSNESDSDEEPGTPPPIRRSPSTDGDRNLTPPPKQAVQKKPGRKPTKGRSPGRGRPRKGSPGSSGPVSSSESEYGDENVKPKPGKAGKPKSSRRAAAKKPSPTVKPEESTEPFGEDYRRQCLGPRCENPARFRSKYCSDECGLRLNACRLYYFLPQRASEWKKTPCMAHEKNKRDLEEIRTKVFKCLERIQHLEGKLRRHMMLVEEVRKLKPDLSASADDSDATSDLEGSMYCITCGMEVSSRLAIKHLEKCYAKYEGQMSFGSAYETKIDGESMFCDAYCPANGMYCKRLKVICPEHYREPKGSENDVCGCPLTDDDIFRPNGKYCLRLKRKCTKHYLWDRLRRAEIDALRVKEFLTRDDLFDEERQVRTAMGNRAGVLALMMHSTFDHTYEEKKLAKHNRRAQQRQQQGADRKREARTPSPRHS